MPYSADVRRKTRRHLPIRCQPPSSRACPTVEVPGTLRNAGLLAESRQGRAMGRPELANTAAFMEGNRREHVRPQRFPWRLSAKYCSGGL